MRYFLDAIFDPETIAAHARYFEAAKGNDDRGRQMRADAIRAANDPYMPRIWLGNDHRLRYRVKAGREVVADG